MGSPEFLLGIAALAGVVAGSVAAWVRMRWWPPPSHDALRRIADLERAFPGWQAEMVRLAESATQSYAQARDERARAQAQHAATARARDGKREAELAEQEALAAMTPEQRARVERDREKARIAARYLR